MRVDGAAEHGPAAGLCCGASEQAASAPLATADGTFALREAHSLERLLDQAAFFLHRSPARCPDARASTLEDLHESRRASCTARRR